MSKHSGRTIRSLGFQGDIWPILDQWATDNNYMLAISNQSSRVYERDNAPLSKRMLKMISSDNGYVLEAWIGVYYNPRIGNLGLLMPSNFRIDGGMKGREMNIEPMREEVNLLLSTLGEPPID